MRRSGVLILLASSLLLLSGCGLFQVRGGSGGSGSGGSGRDATASASPGGSGYDDRYYPYGFDPDYPYYTGYGDGDHTTYY